MVSPIIKEYLLGSNVELVINQLVVTDYAKVCVHVLLSIPLTL